MIKIRGKLIKNHKRLLFIWLLISNCLKRPKTIKGKNKKVVREKVKSIIINKKLVKIPKVNLFLPLVVKKRLNDGIKIKGKYSAK